MKQRVLVWFRDRAVQRVVRYGLPLTIGKAVTSVTGLVTLALLARQLGPELLGVVALIRTVVSVTEQYANFNTWQAVIKYGTTAMAAQRHADVERIIKLAVVVDVVTAIVASLAIVGLAFAIPGVMGWSADEALLCAFYAVTVLTRVAGASDGIFRICDSYHAQAISTTFAAIISMAAVALAVAFDASLAGCLLALAIGEVIGNVYIMTTSFWVAAKHGYGGWPRRSLRGAREAFPGITHFMVATNAQLTVRKAMAELDMVVVGSMLGKAPAGLLRVIKQFGTIPARVFMPFEQVLFTELAHAAAVRDYTGFARLVRRSAALATIGSVTIWGVAALLAEPIIRLVAGAEFVAAAGPFRWYLLAMVLGVANAPVLRSLIALGRPGALFMLDLATLGVLVPAMIAFAWQWGLAGSCAAVLLHRVAHMAGAMWLVARVLRECEKPERAPPPEPAQR